MNRLPIIQQALGDRWDRLAAPIRKHYTIQPMSSMATCLNGTLFVEYPAFMIPVIRVIRNLGGLVDGRGSQIETVVRKRARTSDSGLYWHRSLRYADGSETTFSSRMEYLQDNEIIEYIQFGVGVRLRLTEEAHDLVYRSHGHILRLGSIKIVFPDWLLLGSATIREHAVSDSGIELDFKIEHPLWGRTYAYRGVFSE